MRQTYHQTAAEIWEKRWLASQGADADACVNALAYHLTQSNQRVKALNILISAGEKAADYTQ